MAKKKGDAAEHQADGKNGSDDDKASKKDKKKGAEQDVVDPNAPGLPGYIAIGLLASLVVGWGALRDALLGYGPLDEAMSRFVIGLLACVAGASLIGRLLDGAPPLDPDDSEDQPATPESDSADASFPDSGPGQEADQATGQEAAEPGAEGTTAGGDERLVTERAVGAARPVDPKVATQTAT